MNDKTFGPLSVLIGLGAGSLASRLFPFVWGKLTDEEAPDPEKEDISFARLAGALVLEGAIVFLVRGFVDHGARRAWARKTGSWPGGDNPAV